MPIVDVEITLKENEAELIANTVAPICKRSAENKHIIYEPGGSGRIAFGGKLIT
jgi:hypothetical protein